MATTIVSGYVDKGAIDMLGEHGKFFTVVFVKESGELRHMVCRLAVSKHLKGSNRRQSTEARAVWDTVKREYRSFRYDRIVFATRGTVTAISLANMGLSTYIAYITDKVVFTT